MITASIVTFNNNIKDLEKAFASCVDTTIEELYVIDNSTNSQIKTLSNSYDRLVKYISGQGNIGFGGAHNIGIRLAISANSKYHIIINPDIHFEKSVVEELFKFMENNSDIGCVMPLVKYPDGQNQYVCKLLPTPFDLVGRRFIPIKKLIEKRNYKYELRASGYDKLMEVPCVSGCFMFIRTEILERINGFDARFFMYCEDVDLSRRIGMTSKIVMYPRVHVVHNYEKGSYKNGKLLQYHIISAIKYFNKWGWFFDKDRKRINQKVLDSITDFKSKE